MTPRPTRNPGNEWSPFADVDQAGDLVVQVSPSLLLALPAAMTGSDVLGLARMTTSQALRWLVGEDGYAQLLQEYAAPVDGSVDDDVLTDIVSVAVEHSTGLPLRAATGLALAAGHHWEALCAKAGWHVDVGALPARRFLALTVATLSDPTTAKATETAREFTARLTSIEDDRPVIRRKRRRRRKARSTPR